MEETFQDRVWRVTGVDLNKITVDESGKFTVVKDEFKYTVNIIDEEIVLQEQLTFGQKAVGLNFNHGTGEIFEQVDRAKRLSADLIDLLEHSLKVKESKLQQGEKLSWMINVFRTTAFNAIIAAQMAVVKFITWKD